MKPRRLVIEGLRSHRERTEIDFSDVSLFAIVGDTGSGKSSILEAIVYALYAAATWTKQPGELISDGKRTMTVELTFEVDGRVWIVRRSMSRGGYPGAYPPADGRRRPEHPIRFRGRRRSGDRAPAGPVRRCVLFRRDPSPGPVRKAPHFDTCRENADSHGDLPP